jgi:hypothetical protein
MHRRIKVVFALTGALCLLATQTLSAKTPSPIAAKVAANSALIRVPLIVENNRPIIVLGVRGATGRVVLVRTVLDTGGGSALILAGRVGSALNLSVKGDVMQEDGVSYSEIAVRPQLMLGGTVLNVGDALMALTQSPNYAVGLKEDFQGFAGVGQLLGEHYLVELDYPGRQLLLYPKGSLPTLSHCVAAPIHPGARFARIELSFAGQTEGFLFDTGASYSMATQAWFEANRFANPTLKHLPSALGAANMSGASFEANMPQWQMPSMALSMKDLSVLDLGPVNWVARPFGVFEKRMSKVMVKPIIGALGGNVLANYRWQIDYARGQICVAGKAGAHATRVNHVGITIVFKPLPTIAAIAPGVLESGNAESRRPGLKNASPHIGQHLVAIDGQPTLNMTMTQLQRNLSGNPGEVRRLRLREGDGETEVALVVQDFFAHKLP